MEPSLSDNHELRRQLQSLVDEARSNEQKMRRFDQLERNLIAARSLPDLIQLILTGMKSMFDTDAVTLVLVDPEYEITRILKASTREYSETPGLVILEKFFNDNLQPYLGRFDTEVRGAIFDPWPSGCQSMALLPLIRQGNLIGSLNLGSSRTDRFDSDSGTFFLERLAAIISICLENSLNLERLKLAGLTDHLTGANNRRYFETRCLEEVAHARGYHQSLACMFIDIDRFKSINDSMGHLAGDEVLRDVARLIKSQLRSSDIVARYGGEEFVVLMPQTVLSHACETAERVRTAIGAQSFHPQPGARLTITVSIGVSMLPERLTEGDSSAVQHMISAADGALYQAKQAGRNKVVCARSAGMHAPKLSGETPGG